MKPLLLLSLFFSLFFSLFSSCTIEKTPLTEKTIEKTQEKITPPKFMSQAEVKQAFVARSGQKASSEYLTDSAKERLANTIPADQFLTQKQLSKRKVRGQKYNAKGYADLREFDSPVSNQVRGDCTSHGLRNAIDNLGRTQVSARHIWSGYEEYLCEAAINKWTGGGCITEDKAWPYESVNPYEGYKEPDNCKTYLKESTYIDDSLDKMKESLDKGNPVYLGITVTNSMANCETALSPNSAATNGGHALAILGYKDDANIKGGGYFIIKNSWGADCADKGYQYVPYQYCKRKDMYCVMWSIDKVEINFIVPTPTPLPAPETKCIKWKRVWYAPWKLKCLEWSQEKKVEVHVLSAD